MPANFAIIGRGVRALDPSQTPVWGLSDVEPIVRSYSWEIITTEETPVELTTNSSGINIVSHYNYQTIFTQVVEKRFNYGTSDILSSGQMTANPTSPPSSFQSTQTYFRPDLDQITVFPLPTNIAASAFITGSRSWNLDKMTIDFNIDSQLYILTAYLKAVTYTKEYPTFASKFTIPSWSSLPDVDLQS